MLYRVKYEVAETHGCIGTVKNEGYLWFKLGATGRPCWARYKSLATGREFLWLDDEVEAADVVPSEA
jgi:hypothetical protein